jgi:serine O-acetyltransferase
MRPSDDDETRPRLPGIIERMVESYGPCGSINHLGYSALPSRREVIQILEDLFDLLYPGFGRKQNLHQENVIYHVGDLVDGLYERLRVQICRAMNRRECEETRNEGAPARSADAKVSRRIVADFLDSLPEIRAVLAEDVEAAFDGDPAAKGFDEIIFCYPGTYAITAFRLAHRLHELGVPLIPRMMTEHAHARTGIDIHPGATIGRRFFIDHGTGVVIGETTLIGENVKLYQGVTLGALSFPKDENGALIRNRRRHPTIEDGVVIYANATILGGETTIGHHAVIGSSVWITRSVEPYTVVTIESPNLRFRNGQPVE